ncbi:MAG: periplasmic nitrate reductase, NapE protein [Rhodospirillales bacterium 69-11]|nr:periplasmic nitrate reductase, NapE protein [Rhodospirillales bacterium]OJW31267.1 MAG: periplasmic nitrate reductase, NapE protein [Rhodospirillales bacterium 69-11]
MQSDPPRATGATSGSAVRRQELFVFLLLAVFAWPVLTVGFVGAYGFAVWMSQQVYGPPSYGSGGHGH